VGGCHLQSEWNGWMEILVGKAVGFYGVVNIIRWDIYFIFRHEISLFIVYIIIFFSLSLSPFIALFLHKKKKKIISYNKKQHLKKKKKKKKKIEKTKVRQTHLRFSQGKNTKNPEPEQMVQ
jgi:phosphotransferase system  glucose/maltose/N-acetylglucosamine-specific IIC component